MLPMKMKYFFTVMNFSEQTEIHMLIKLARTNAGVDHEWSSVYTEVHQQMKALLASWT